MIELIDLLSEILKIDDKGLWCGEDNSEYCRYKFSELKKLNKMRI